jgi:hypothetical protein
MIYTDSGALHDERKSGQTTIATNFLIRNTYYFVRS